MNVRFLVCPFIAQTTLLGRLLPKARGTIPSFTLRADDDDFSQAATLVTKVMDDAARERLVGNVAGHLLGGVEEPVLTRAFEYWLNIDAAIGQRIKDKVAQQKG